MKYTIDQAVFRDNKDLCFGIIIATEMKNMESQDIDGENLKEAEEYLKGQLTLSELKTYPRVAVYRDAMRNVGINPNKFRNSVEAVCKRVLKYGDIPQINAIVDMTNIIAMREFLALGAHDMRDIKDDLELRYSTEKDKFLPIGKTEEIDMPAGELVFVSGRDVQTRQWMWRQNDMGKVMLDSTDILFQIVGFRNDYYENFQNAMKTIESSIVDRFGGKARVFQLDADKRSIEF